MTQSKEDSFTEPISGVTPDKDAVFLGYAWQGSEQQGLVAVT